jgi:hypothetical protein
MSDDLANINWTTLFEAKDVVRIRASSACRSAKCTQVVMQVFDLYKRKSNQDMLAPLATIIAFVQQTSPDNSCTFLIDLRNASGFSLTMIPMLLSWIRKNKAVFALHIFKTCVVVGTGGLATSFVKQVLGLVSTARPLTLTTIQETPDILVKSLDSAQLQLHTAK